MLSAHRLQVACVAGDVVGGGDDDHVLDQRLVRAPAKPVVGPVHEAEAFPALHLQIGLRRLRHRDANLREITFGQAGRHRGELETGEARHSAPAYPLGMEHKARPVRRGLGARQPHRVSGGEVQLARRPVEFIGHIIVLIVPAPMAAVGVGRMERRMGFRSLVGTDGRGQQAVGVSLVG